MYLQYSNILLILTFLLFIAFIYSFYLKILLMNHNLIWLTIFPFIVHFLLCCLLKIIFLFINEFHSVCNYINQNNYFFLLSYVNHLILYYSSMHLLYYIYYFYIYKKSIRNLNQLIIKIFFKQCIIYKKIIYINFFKFTKLILILTY